MGYREGTPLPELPPCFHDSPSILGAYSQILNLEKSEQAAYSRDPSAGSGKRLIYTRILGYLILEGPSDQARTAVALEVNACSGDEERLLAIGQLYFDHYIRAFRLTRNKCRTPASSSDFSRRPSLDPRKAMIKAMLMEAPQNHKQAKANALVRDGFRCVISSQYDLNSVERSKELELERAADATGNLCCTECAHIFPELTNAKISSNNAADKLPSHYASSVRKVLERFGNKKALDELNGGGIHRLENILTLDHSTRYLFDTLRMWLEPVEGGIPNTYKLCAARPYYINSGWKRIVTFTTPDPVKLPVPSPWYLELHAACCRVANLSGAGECIDKVLRDMEDIQVLSQDGSSAEVLQYALSPWSQEISVH